MLSIGLDIGSTTIKSVVLDENGKIEEVVRLVGGNINSESAILYAKELLKEAKAYKDSIY